MAVRRGKWGQFTMLIHDVMREQMHARAHQQGFVATSEWLRMLIRQELNHKSLPNAAYRPRRKSPKVPYQIPHNQEASDVGSKGTSDTCPNATGTPQSPPTTDQSKLE